MTCLSVSMVTLGPMSPCSSIVDSGAICWKLERSFEALGSQDGCLHGRPLDLNISSSQSCLGLGDERTYLPSVVILDRQIDLYVLWSQTS